MNKVITGSIIGITAIGALAVAPLSVGALTNTGRGGAYGANGSGNGLEIKAQAMDMTTEQLKEKLQTKTTSEIITEQGITTDQYQEKVRSASQERWKEMGLSEDEIKTRTQDQIERQAECDGMGLNHSQSGARYGQNNR